MTPVRKRGIILRLATFPGLYIAVLSLCDLQIGNLNFPGLHIAVSSLCDLRIGSLTILIVIKVFYATPMRVCLNTNIMTWR